MKPQRELCTRRAPHRRRRAAATGAVARVIVGLALLTSALLAACGAPSTRPIDTGHTHQHCHEADGGEACHTHGHDGDGHDGGAR